VREYGSPGSTTTSTPAVFPKSWFLRTIAYVEFSISTPIALVVTAFFSTTT